MKQVKFKRIDLSNLQPITKVNMKKILGGTMGKSPCNGFCHTNADCLPLCVCSAINFMCVEP